VVDHRFLNTYCRQLSNSRVASIASRSSAARRTTYITPVLCDLHPLVRSRHLVGDLSGEPGEPTRSPRARRGGEAGPARRS
jgi:hypothetical protein